jgi:multiple sugar transport system permease protein
MAGDSTQVQSRGAKRYAIEAVVIVVSLLFLAPVVLIYLTALKPDSEIIQFTGLVPHHPTLLNFRHILGSPEEIPIFRWMFNSLFISAATTALVLAVTSLAAYALARLHLRGSRVLFSLIIATLMVPGQILLVPNYLILTKLGWIDTPLALIVPAGAGAFGVFLLHQFFKAVPRELEEAAELDGCNRLQTFWHIMLPQARPAMATLGLLTFVGSWNDFLGPLVFLDSTNQFTLPVGVALFQGSYTIEYGLTLAACVICTTPILIIFLLFQKNIVQAVSMGGMKE